MGSSQEGPQAFRRRAAPHARTWASGLTAAGQPVSRPPARRCRTWCTPAGPGQLSPAASAAGWCSPCGFGGRGVQGGGGDRGRKAQGDPGTQNQKGGQCVPAFAALQPSCSPPPSSLTMRTCRRGNPGTGNCRQAQFRGKPVCLGREDTQVWCQDMRVSHMQSASSVRLSEPPRAIPPLTPRPP